MPNASDAVIIATAPSSTMSNTGWGYSLTRNSAAKRRVLGIELRYSTGAKAAYEQRLALGGV